MKFLIVHACVVIHNLQKAGFLPQNGIFSAKNWVLTPVSRNGKRFRWRKAIALVELGDFSIFRRFLPI